MSHVCVVTGCNERHGFGWLIAEELHRRGSTVVATMRDVAARNRDPAAELGGVADVRELDVTDDAEATAFVDAVLRDHGRIDAIVNNAAVVRHGPAEQVAPDTLLQVLDANVVGPHRLIRAALPHLRERGSGVIVQVSSINGFSVAPLSASYCASKFALEAYSEVLAYEVGRFGIRVVIVEPSGFSTGVHVRAVWEPGTEVGPYGPLKQAYWDADLEEWTAEMEDPRIVARAVADAVEDADTPLHVPVGGPAVRRRARYRPVSDDALRRDALEGVDW